MRNFIPELRTKLDVVDEEFFINHFQDLTRGATEAYAVIANEYPELFRPLLKEQVNAACWIIEEGHAREALYEIMYDVTQQEVVRYNASVLYNELEEDGLLEESQNNTCDFEPLTGEELHTSEEHNYYIREIDPSTELNVNFSSEDLKEAITDLLKIENTATIQRLVEHFDKNEYCIKAALMELLDEGIVNCLEGEFSLAIGYELKDNFIFKLAHSSRSSGSEFFSEEDMLSDNLWDDDQEYIFLDSDPEFEKSFAAINAQAVTQGLPFSSNSDDEE